MNKNLISQNKIKILRYISIYFAPVFALAFFGCALVWLQWMFLGQKGEAFKVGSPAPETYRAISPMRYDDKTATETLKKLARDKVVSVTVRDMAAKSRLRRRLEELGALRDNVNAQYPPYLPEALVKAIVNLSAADRFRILNLTAQVGSAYIDRLEAENISSVNNNAAETALLWQEINNLSLPANDANFIYQILSRLGNLNFSSDAELTEMAREAAADDIPAIERRFEIGDVIIARDEIVTAQTANLLRLQGYTEDMFPVTHFAIVIMLAFLLPMWMSIPIKEIKDDLPSNQCVIVIILTAWLLEILAARLLKLEGAGIAPAVLMSYLCVSDFSFAFTLALAACASAALIIMGLAISDLILILAMSIIAATLGFYLFRRLESKTQISKRFVIFILIMTAARLSILWIQGIMPNITFEFDLDGSTLLNECVLFAIADIAGCVGIVSILPLVEDYLGVLSALRLRDLSHPSSKLLRQMQRETPGTYQHCLTIATLAEAVAPELGLNINLMKSGAYYHDIGKMRKPQYFVENQGGGANTHDKLTPKMSAMSIIWHVKDGLETAREAKLPKRIQDFIAEHHGTTCVRYFYNKARAEAKPGEVIEWSDFCYPGPKPQSKETALLMIIDSIEAAVRSANLGRRPSDYDNNHENKGKSQYILALQQIISQVINSKINEGQFDEVNLTQKDITKIKGALLNALLSMYHTRSVKKIEKK